MDIRISFPITSGMTVSVSVDELKNIVDKVDAGGDDLPEIESRVAKDVIRKMQNYDSPDNASFDAGPDIYKEILTNDAEQRISKRFGRTKISVEDFVSWCWEQNAGYWPDGTPIGSLFCDD